MVVFYIIRNLIRLLIATALLPLILFTRRYASMIVMILAAIGLWQCVMKPAPSAPPSGKGVNGQPLILVNPVRTEEDGNSVFATDLIAKMSEEERIRYSQHFYWALNQGNAGQKYTWNHHNIAGEITIEKVFKNKTGAACKHFSEVLKVHEIRQTLLGLACARGDGSWCKLRRNATPACGLGKERGMFDGLTRSLNNIF
jgi:surface antigen